MTNTLEPQLEQKADEVCKTAERNPVVVVGYPGSGRATLAEVVAVRMAARACRVRLLPQGELDFDADALTQLSAALGEWKPLTDASLEGIRSYASEAARELAARDVTLLISVPHRKGGGGDHAMVMERGNAILAGLRSSRKRVEFGGTDLLASQNAAAVVRLEVHNIAVHRSAGTWGACEPAFVALEHELTARAMVVPSVLRLGVGVVHLGGDPRTVARNVVLPAAEATFRLVQQLDVLTRTRPALREAMQALALLRRPLPSAHFLRAVSPPPGLEDLFTGCLAYGDPVRVPALVSSQLHAKLGVAPQEEAAHGSLAAAFKALDGVASPSQAAPGALLHWSEKLHHLAHGGEATRSEWSAQEHVFPSTLWERARAESLAHRYQQAIDIYQLGVSRFGRDDYGWHYLGFNMQRAKFPAEQYLAPLQRAVQLAPENPWWNSRLISLLARTDPARSREECERALVRVDPSGDRALEGTDFADQFHYWVAKAWWDAGRGDEALKLLDRVLGLGASDASRTAELRDAILREREAFRDYLDHGLGVRGVPADVVARASAVWDWLETSFTYVPVPSTGTRAHGGTDLTWRIGGWNVEVEFLTGDDEAESGWWMSGPQLGGSLSGSLDEREPLHAAFAEFLRYA
jgi:tetratricopeptide (TPR) repeat protein